MMMPTHRQSNDSHIADFLPAYVNGTLDHDAVMQVRAHLDRCAACRDDLAEWNVVASATRMFAGTLPPPDAQGLDSVWSSLNSGEPEVRSRPSRHRVPSSQEDQRTRQERATMQSAWPVPYAQPRLSVGRSNLRWIAASLVLVIAIGFAAYIRLGGPEDPARLPAAMLASPETDACLAATGSLDRLTLEGVPSTASVVMPSAGTFEGRPGVAADALPTGGEPADQATVDGIAQTAQELVGCMNAGDAAGTSALTTDDYWRRTNEAGVSVNPDKVRSFVPLVGPVDGPTPAPAVEDARVLPDGRVGAIVRPGFDAPPWTFDYYIFANVDGRWLIDEAVHVTEFLTVDVVVTDDGFSPEKIAVPPVPATLSVTNEGTQPHSFVISDLLIRIEVAPGETGTTNLKAPSGTYDVTSDIPGDDAGVFSGTLTIEGGPAATPVATPGDTEAAEPPGPGVPVASATITLQPPTAYVPNQVTILADRAVEITLVNEGPDGFDANVTIDALGISVDLAPGQSETIMIKAPEGVYAFHSTIPGHTEVGMSGTLYVTDPGTPAP